MRSLLVIALAMVLTACERQAEPTPDSPAETAISVEPDGDIGVQAKTQTDANATAGEIPARFHGIWDAIAGNCDASSDTRVEIAARRIEYFESVGEVSGMGSDGDDAIVDLVMEGEGETWVQPSRLSLEATSAGERLRITDATKPESSQGILRKRCAK